MLNLPAHARVWIFQANRFLEEKEVQGINNELKDFIQSWASHGNELFGDFSIESDLFVVIGVDEQRAPASGCSIDKLTHKVKELGEKYGIDFFNRLIVAYEDESTKLHLVSLGEFKTLMSKDVVRRSTVVYNNLIENVGELDENWRTTVQNSWHKNLLQVI